MRSCDGCTKCCEGWLTGEAHGRKFFPGAPCHFVKLGVGCSIYEKRPEDPCKVFKCHWLTNEEIPEWMKPEISDVIITKKKIGDIEYYNFVECGKVLDPRILNWIVFNLVLKNQNVVYTIDNGRNYIGSTDFVKLMKEKK